jgi:hypothetical protein
MAGGKLAIDICRRPDPIRGMKLYISLYYQWFQHEIRQLQVLNAEKMASV